MRRSLIPLVLLPLLVLGVAGRSAPARSAPARVSFGTPVFVTGSDTYAEPSVAVAPNDGTIYVTAPGGFAGSGMWRSSDGGATWTAATTPDAAAGGLDSDVAVAPDGSLYATGLSLGCVTVSRSIDKGTTWVPNPLACTTAPLDDRNWIDLDGGTDLYLTFGSNQIIVGASTVLASPAAVTGPMTDLSPPGVYQWPGNVAVDDAHHIAYVAYNTAGRVVKSPKSTLDDDIVVVKTADRGATWQSVVVARRAGDTFDSFVAVDTDDAGNVYAVWSERHAANNETKNTGVTDTILSVSRDHGAHWSRPVVVDSAKTTPTTVFPWLVAGASGRLGIVYYGTKTRGFSPETTGLKSVWYAYAAVSTNALAAKPKFSIVKVDPKPVHVGGICTSGTGCGTSDRDLLDFFEVDLDPHGHLVVAYADDAFTDDPAHVGVFVAVQRTGPALR